MKKEICINCDQETGRAGELEDSLYPVLSTRWGLLCNSDRFGPVCEGCHNAMCRLGMVEKDGENNP